MSHDQYLWLEMVKQLSLLLPVAGEKEHHETNHVASHGF